MTVIRKKYVFHNKNMVGIGRMEKIGEEDE